MGIAQRSFADNQARPRVATTLPASAYGPLLAATLATLMAGCVAGIFSSGEGVSLLRTSEAQGVRG